ncbi:2Fe-2S iron-sulfur cluster binding domain-containing protein (plasmid) [Phormidium sp. CLA17]|uniref:2Fe-2S iron-sulfur cluster-binding protein n=1 Tax=Leptolyngbya sp. Cla-17 TaxID=2803751 RepID=UPI001492A07B|nr:2Fe-2S iron-sulfur cluster-binding protein [Leptolyngbya sp. Cla-17]MBM0745434.1 2Fe-2S iron-sulfur cluster binding domain-containing protein [Leptolyngbya sp. Cla-17]
MFESLGRIQNPFVRSLTAAFTTLSVITLTSAIAIGVTKSKDESAYKTAVYASFIGAGCGALFGFASKSKGNQRTAQPTQTTDSTIWKDWRNFVVVRKVKESEEITSFYLQPEDKGDIPNFQPGQFLTIKLDIPGQARSVIRTYSLSDYPEPCDYYRLSIKREPMPPGLDVMPGIASNFMHDQVHEGSVIPAKPPSGKFILDVQKAIPAVLISNGVGITPMMSMAKAVARLNPNRPLWFLHGARDGSFDAFREEVDAIAAQNPNLTVHYAYSRPRGEDTGYYHSTGYVDIDLIQSLIIQEAEYFLCGSPPFLESIRAGLKEVGVPESRVFFEMFTKASKTASDRPIAEVNDDNVEAAEIVFAQSNQTITWQTDADSILDFAETNGLNPPYSCRQGICGTCECKILEGEVEYQTMPTATVEDGSVLICISKPKTSKVVLDL